jgi:hypothetical protein
VEAAYAAFIAVLILAIAEMMMPLEKTSSKKAVGRNIKKEMAAGKPHDQAVAISLSNQRRMKAKGK